MIWWIEVGYKPGATDAPGEALKKDIKDLGIKEVEEVRIIQVYTLEGEIAQDEVERISRELLADPITQYYVYGNSSRDMDAQGWQVVEVAYNPGVMDPVEGSVKKALKDMGILRVERVRTARKFLIKGDISREKLAIICNRLLFNPVIEHLVYERERLLFPSAEYRFRRVEVDLLGADEAGLLHLSWEGMLNLNLDEMWAIQDYFRRLGRNPTDVELETFAQTWSEHCVHKTFKGLIEYEGKLIDNLLKSTIMRVTEELARPWCISVFVDNAGIIEFDEHYGVCFKVETHNHPSAIEPYGGASTGIGGVIRDILGTGLGGKPIANTDVFCFAPPDLTYEELPPGILHPKRLFKGVVAGVRDYGNRMGIPTLNGAVLFDPGYVGNPVVYCGTVGLIPKEKCHKEVKPGDLIVLAGGRTGRDGIHGVTFASGGLTPESQDISTQAVQIGNPIMEKKLADVLLQARDRGLYRAITDCGGGGLSSAVGEMGRETGVLVELDRVPLKYQGLSYTEIWISESQERMVLAVPPDKVEELLEVFAQEDVEATVIGRFPGDGKLRLRYEGHKVADIDMDFLHRGLPRVRRRAVWKRPQYPEPDFPDLEDLTPYLKDILSSWNVCSKEWVIRQYDHEVQGGSVLKPLQGAHNDGPGDATVIRPLLDSYRGLIIVNGINPRYGLIDPYHMAASAIDEALRQVIAVGGNLERVALLDNFSWGNPEDPERLGELVRAALACYDIAKGYGVPFISGKDSLYNEYLVDGKSIPIPPTLLISALGVMEDVRRAVSMDAKKPGDLVYVVGTTHAELGGSHYYLVRGYIGNNVPQVDLQKGKKAMEALSQAIALGLVRACHDCSEGGIGVAAAEMAFAGGLGMELHLGEVPISGGIDRNDTILFSESNSRFMVEVAPEHQREFEEVMVGVDFGLVGKVTGDRKFLVYGLNGSLVVSADVDDLKEAWQRPLRW